jgi:hypothetical protein
LRNKIERHTGLSRDSPGHRPGLCTGATRCPKRDASRNAVEGFFDNFYNVDVLGPDRISDQAWQASFNVAAGSSPYATYAFVDTWLTDFREDVPEIVYRSGALLAVERRHVRPNADVASRPVSRAQKPYASFT